MNKASTEEQRKKIKASAHDMRTVAESLFKLIVCFYQKELPQKGYNYKVRDYNLSTLGDLADPLKKTIFINKKSPTDNVRESSMKRRFIPMLYTSTSSRVIARNCLNSFAEDSLSAGMLCVAQYSSYSFLRSSWCE